MSEVKFAKIGVYGPKQRNLQRRISFERTALTHKIVRVWKYAGSRTNATPTLADVPDPIFLEVADRAYDAEPVEINAWYEFLPESQFDLSRFGIVNPLGNTQLFKFHIDSFDTDGLGRYPYEGDIIEVPFLAEGDFEEKPSYWEVTDVDKKSEFENFYVVVTTVPMAYSQETLEIPGDNHDGDLFDQLQDDIENFQETEFTETGFDDSAYQDVDQPTRKEYDPRPNNAEPFLDLDDPNKRVF